MILVNNPGTWSAIYPPLQHADWHGWTPTDLIFPFFLFIIGVSMTYSFAARLESGAAQRQLALHVLRRSAIIFALGLFLNGFPYFDLSKIRVPGVLQRIAVCYLCAALIYLWTQRRGQLAAIAGLLAGYWAVMTLVPVPGFGTGRLDADGNLAAYIDRALMLGHLWKPTWDPEGLLSTFPATATVLLGGLAGEWLHSGRNRGAEALGLVAWGAAGLAAGQIWDVWFPINKNLWTSSYVIFTAGFAAVLLGLCYWIIDIKGWRRWAAPFVVYGMNAIAVFTLSGVVAKISILWKFSLDDGRTIALKTLVFEKVFLSVASPINASLLFALSYVLLWLGLMWILYARRIFIKI